jgi:hypothetical protein
MFRWATAQLLKKALPPVRWIVPQIMPEGCLLLAGRPKGGKSWLMLQASLELAEGGPVWQHFPCQAAGALYISLEDGERRLQSRLGRLMGQVAPTNWHYAVAAPTLGNGLVEQIHEWLAGMPTVQLVVIDTLTRVRGRSGHRGSNYEIDYDSLAPFGELGRENAACIGVIHHTRKPKEGEDEDPFDTISGTLGLGAAADTMWVLKRPVNSLDARLYCRGRDLVEDLGLTLSWDQDECHWKVAAGDALPPEQQRALEALKDAGRPLTALELAEGLQKTHEAVKMLLSRMKAAGLVRSSQGRYVPVLPALPST